MRKPRNFWTKEKCINEAIKFNTKRDWRKYSTSSYSIAKSNKWIDECSTHMEILGSKYRRLIYAFEFPDKSVYVGLTHDPNGRKRQHFKNVKGIVYQHMTLTMETPKHVLLSDYMNANIASIKEGEFVDLDKRRLY